nr:ImmA/IrrE family metallo-endopeptidase [Micromonospora sp. DSM 115978]
MNAQVPDPLSAGQILGGELEARGWTQADFAAVLDRPTQFVSEIVTGKKEITRESAAQIGAALGTNPEYWLNLQDEYLLSVQAKDQATQKTLDDVRRRARLNELAPISTLRKRGILTGRTLAELEAEVMALFEIQSLDDELALTVAARRSNCDEPVSHAQKTWVACVRRQARYRSDVGKFSKTKLVQLPARFAAVGVSLVYVEALPGARIDGCSFVLGETPVIGLSGRGKRLDKILFTLLHEIAHIVLGHVTEEAIVDSLDEQDDSDTNELDANRQAGRWILPRPLPPVPHRVSADWINRVAAERGLAPIVVVGRLQNDGRLEWRSTLAKNAPTVTTALETW